MYTILNEIRFKLAGFCLRCAQYLFEHSITIAYESDIKVLQSKIPYYMSEFVEIRSKQSICTTYYADFRINLKNSPTFAR